jgi:hypothetical protein
VWRSFSIEDRAERFTVIQAGGLVAIAALAAVFVFSVLGGGSTTSRPVIGSAAARGLVTPSATGQVRQLESLPAPSSSPGVGVAPSAGSTTATSYPQSPAVESTPSSAAGTVAPGVAAAATQRSTVIGSTGRVASPVISGGRQAATSAPPVSPTSAPPVVTGSPVQPVTAATHTSLARSSTAGVSYTAASAAASSAFGPLSVAAGSGSGSSATCPGGTLVTSPLTGAAGGTACVPDPGTNQTPADPPAGATIGLTAGDYTPGGLLVGEGGYIGAGNWQQNVAHPGDVIAFGGFTGSPISYDVTTGQYVATASLSITYDVTKGYVEQ